MRKIHHAEITNTNFKFSPSSMSRGGILLFSDLQDSRIRELMDLRKMMNLSVFIRVIKHKSKSAFKLIIREKSKTIYSIVSQPIDANLNTFGNQIFNDKTTRDAYKDMLLNALKPIIKHSKKSVRAFKNKLERQLEVREESTKHKL